MGPATDSIMSTSSTSLKIVNLEKLKDDGSNWITYKERVLNTLTHKGLRRHVNGSVRKPDDLQWRNKTATVAEGFYKPDGTKPLSEDEIEEHEKKIDEYEQKQASVREVIYETISRSIFLRIKNEKTAAEVWKALSKINEDKGSLIQVDTLTKLQNLVCSDDGDIHKHISSMIELKEKLAGMGHDIDDNTFSAMI
jgi:hypothetical protein